MGRRGQRVIRQKVVKQESVRVRKSVNWGQFAAGIFITVFDLFLLFVAGVMLLMSH